MKGKAQVVTKCWTSSKVMGGMTYRVVAFHLECLRLYCDCSLTLNSILLKTWSSKSLSSSFEIFKTCKILLGALCPIIDSRSFIFSQILMIFIMSIVIFFLFKQSSRRFLQWVSPYCKESKIENSEKGVRLCKVAICNKKLYWRMLPLN